MSKLFAAMALSAFALPALAVSGDSSGADMSEWNCNCSCPLAVQANTSRTFGLEALATSTVARADLADTFEANLARI